MRIALVGNPNVGKSTLFNALTHSHQHTGNWPGKTVSLATGYWQDDFVVDLPGTYSLVGSSPEETISAKEILQGDYDVFLFVADATCLEKSLVLLFQLLEMSHQVCLVLNLMDEAKRKKIEIDIDGLIQRLGIPVCALSATEKTYDARLRKNIDKMANIQSVICFDYPRPLQEMKDAGQCLLNLVKTEEVIDICEHYGMKFSQVPLICKSIYHHEAKLLASKVCQYHQPIDKKQVFLDRLFTGKITSWLSMGFLLLMLLWITLSLANIPSQFLGEIFFKVEWMLADFLKYFLPMPLVDLISHGIYRVLAWVVSVMLPPMAIFFPLFNLLEDFGYLPRMAFNLDACFSKCGSCGKQALTMCMGLGCNAVGVMGARIIESKRDRKIAMMTNAMVPCNGRFPILIQVAAMFFMTDQPLFQALFLVSILAFSLLMSLVVGKLLSYIFRKEKSSFMLEMPDFRKPKLKKVLIDSFIEKTMAVLKRAVVVASMSGAIIWILAHTQIHQVSLLTLIASLLEPLGQFLGIDGVILLAFILGFPANEIVIPLMVMIYLKEGMMLETMSIASLKTLLVGQGWTGLTAFNVLILTVFHWPCSTTCLTIKKETGSWKLTLFTIVLLTLCGFSLMFLVRIMFS